MGWKCEETKISGLRKEGLWERSVLWLIRNLPIYDVELPGVKLSLQRMQEIADFGAFLQMCRDSHIYGLISYEQVLGIQ